MLDGVFGIVWFATSLLSVSAGGLPRATEAITAAGLPRATEATHNRTLSADINRRHLQRAMARRTGEVMDFEGGSCAVTHYTSYAPCCCDHTVGGSWYDGVDPVNKDYTWCKKFDESLYKKDTEECWQYSACEYTGMFAVDDHLGKVWTLKEVQNTDIVAFFAVGQPNSKPEFLGEKFTFGSGSNTFSAKAVDTCGDHIVAVVVRQMPTTKEFTSYAISKSTRSNGMG